MKRIVVTTRRQCGSRCRWTHTKSDSNTNTTNDTIQTKSAETSTQTSQTPIQTRPLTSYKPYKRTWKTCIPHPALLTSTSFEFTLLTYNILASTKLQYYPYTHPSLLSTSYRQTNITSELRSYNTDIISLQECDYYDEYWKIALYECGYDSVYKSRFNTETIVDGCVIAYKRELYELISTHEINYKHLPQRYANDCIAIATLLRHKPTNKYLCIINTHLIYNSKRNDVKIGQLRMLNDEVYRWLSMWLSKQPSNTHVSMCVTGDLNLVPESGLMKYMLNGSWNYRSTKMIDYDGIGTHDYQSNMERSIHNRVPSSKQEWNVHIPSIPSSPRSSSSSSSPSSSFQRFPSFTRMHPNDTSTQYAHDFIYYPTYPDASMTVHPLIARYHTQLQSASSSPPTSLQYRCTPTSGMCTCGCCVDMFGQSYRYRPTSFQPRSKIPLDYVLFTPMGIIERERMKTIMDRNEIPAITLQPIALYELPAVTELMPWLNSGERTEYDRDGLPTPECSSDHFPLIVKFRYS